MVYEVESWPHTPVSVDSNPAARDCLLQFADYNYEVFTSHEKHIGLESTLISRSFQVCCGLHAPQLRKQWLGLTRYMGVAQNIVLYFVVFLLTDSRKRFDQFDIKRD